MAVTKTIPWQDNSGDNITLSAEQWSGTQTVTLSTPENFGAYRSLNIVFYSKTDSTKSATLRCNQAAATLSFNTTEVVWNSDETDSKTITLSTNVSSIAGIQISLSGDYANKYTLGSVSALSNGRASFTITPTGTNQTANDFDATIEVVLGRLGTYSIPITQYGESVVSETYFGVTVSSDDFGGAGGNISVDGESWTDISLLPATSFNFEVFLPIRYLRLRKRTVYSSGREEVSLVPIPGECYFWYTAACGESVDFGGAGAESVPVDGFERFIVTSAKSKVTAQSTLNSWDLTIPSLGTNITEFDFDGRAGLAVQLNVTLPSGETIYEWYLEPYTVPIQPNKVEGTPTGQTPVLTKVSGSNSLQSGSAFTQWIYRANGVAKFTSGATDSGWNFPVEFSENVSWLTTSNYSAGALQKGNSNSAIIFTATSNADSNTSRSATITMKLPASLGGATLGTATLTQEAGVTSQEFGIVITSQLVNQTANALTWLTSSGSVQLADVGYDTPIPLESIGYGTSGNTDTLANYSAGELESGNDFRVEVFLGLDSFEMSSILGGGQPSYVNVKYTIAFGTNEASSIITKDGSVDLNDINDFTNAPIDISFTSSEISQVFGVMGLMLFVDLVVDNFNQ